MNKPRNIIACLGLFSLFFAACAPPGGSPPAGSWPKRLGGSSTDSGNAVTRDAAGNIYIVGTVALNADLDGDGTIEAGNPEAGLPPYGAYDVFVSKFNSSGLHVWTKRLGGGFLDDGFGVAADAGGNVYVTGTVNGDADLSGDGLVTAGLPETAGSPYGGDDGFLVKFSGAGAFIWAKRLGGGNTDQGGAVVSDGSNVFVTGKVNGNADLDGDQSVAAGLPETVTGTYAGDDVFLAKFNATGTAQWTVRLGGTGIDAGTFVAAAAGGNVAVTGLIEGSADLDGDGAVTGGLPESVTGTYGNADIFLSVFDNATGAVQWTERLGGTGADTGRGVAIASSGKVVVTGYVNGNADLDGDGAVTVGAPETPNATYGGEDIVLASFTGLGAADWSVRLGGTANDQGAGVFTDVGGNVFLTGFVQGSADLDGDGAVAGTAPETPLGIHGLSDIALTEFDTDGLPLWTARLGGPNDDQGRSIASANGKVIVAGTVQLDADLDGDGSITPSLPETVAGVYGGGDAFVTSLTVP